MRLLHGLRTTWLRSVAARRLDSDNAQVRYGGLGVLERLAQDNPAHRQAIVDVICGYLRRPFPAAAPPRRPVRQSGEGRNEPDAEGDIEDNGAGGIRQQERYKWQQERQVRLTAQHILTEHLRDDQVKDQSSADSSGSRFWKHISLDLTGATLIDFSLVNGVVADADFHRASFSGDARFGGAAFTGDAGFRRAAFTGDAGFRRVTFGGDAWFDQAAFGRDASFSEAAFDGDAWFRKAVFGGSAWFDQAAFSRGARFDRAAFTGDAWFSEAAFTGDAWFDQAAFSRDASFGEAAFDGDAWFSEAAFDGDAWFDQAAFSRDASFGEAAFDGGAWFSEVTFDGGAWFGEAAFRRGADALHFDQSRILSPGACHVWPTGWRLAEAGRGGYTVARVNGESGS